MTVVHLQPGPPDKRSGHVNRRSAIFLGGARLAVGTLMAVAVFIGWFGLLPRLLSWLGYALAGLILLGGATGLLVIGLLLLVRLWLATGRQLAIARCGRLGWIGAIAIGTLPNVLIALLVWMTASTDYLAPYLTAFGVLCCDGLLLMIVVGVGYVSRRGMHHCSITWQTWYLPRLAAAPDRRIAMPIRFLNDARYWPDLQFTAVLEETTGLRDSTRYSFHLLVKPPR